MKRCESVEPSLRLQLSSPSCPVYPASPRCWLQSNSAFPRQQLEIPRAALFAFAHCYGVCTVKQLGLSVYMLVNNIVRPNAHNPQKNNERAVFESYLVNTC